MKVCLYKVALKGRWPPKTVTVMTGFTVPQFNPIEINKTLMKYGRNPVYVGKIEGMDNA